ncbi:MAG: cytidylyltransferase domain-containing protein [Candidatus Pseudothioglobus sp.]
MNNKVVAIIQARMQSSRLPGKVLKSVLGKPLLGYLVDRIRKSVYVDDIVIATTLNEKDIAIVDFCKNYKVNFYRGSEDDVLSRYFESSVQFKANHIVRICADSPLLDPLILDEMLELYFENGPYDYVSNTLNQTYPLGMNIEIFPFKILNFLNQNCIKEYEREHVTPYIYTHPKMFKIYKKQLGKDYSHLRLTVDEREDFSLIEAILELLYKQNPNFGLDHILNLYKTRPKLFDLNSKVVQKNYRD